MYITDWANYIKLKNYMILETYSREIELSTTRVLMVLETWSKRTSSKIYITDIEMTKN